MRWLHFILSYSIFSSLCAMALCYQSFTLLHIRPDAFVYVFIFFSTLSSYNFYWLISKYTFSKQATFSRFIKNNLLYIFFFLLAGMGMMVSLYFLPQVYPHVAIAIVLTLLYSLPLWPFKFSVFLRKAGVLKTILLAFTWAYVTVIIPAVPVLFTEGKAVIILMTARFFFMLMLCSIFDRRDKKIDEIHALRSLATEVSQRTLHAIMILTFIVYLAAGFLVRYHFSDNNQLFAFLITGLVVWWVYRLSLKEQGYIFYYFLVDGLMLFSAGTTFIATLL
jgi:4-hydroxybenzoate polyprenyltransferase